MYGWLFKVWVWAIEQCCFSLSEVSLLSLGLDGLKQVPVVSRCLTVGVSPESALGQFRVSPSQFTVSS